MTRQFNVPSRLLSLGTVALLGLGSVGLVTQSAHAQAINNRDGILNSENNTRYTPFISFGSTGSDVEEVQRYLDQEGYYNGQIDGIYGSQTERAVREYQADNNLSVDGIVGSNTWNALSEINIDNNGLSRNNTDLYDSGVQNQNLNNDNGMLDNSGFDNNNMKPGMNNNTNDMNR